MAQREWTIVDDMGVPKVTITADSDIGGLTIEFTPVDWIPVSKLDGIVSMVMSAKDWLVSQGVS